MHTTRNISEKIKSVIRKCSHAHVHGGSSDSDIPYELHAVIEGAKAPKKGCFVGCVGEDEEEEKRNQIPLQYLSHPAFLQLLKQYQYDPDDKIDGPLKIPCTVEFFDRFLKFPGCLTSPPSWLSPPGDAVPRRLALFRAPPSACALVLALALVRAPTAAQILAPPLAPAPCRGPDPSSAPPLPPAQDPFPPPPLLLAALAPAAVAPPPRKSSGEAVARRGRSLPPQANLNSPPPLAKKDSPPP
ncbi:hypothetical protein Tsubulata_049974, partial [Turnera subulata]